MKRVYQNADGVRRTLITDAEWPGRFVVQTEQVVDEIVAGIARDRENHRSGGDVKLAARIPVAIYEQMIVEGWDEDRFKAWLNSPEASPYRIWPGDV